MHTQLKGQVIIEEEAKKGSGEFFSSNESDGFLFNEAILGKAGALVAVGGIRSFNRFSDGDFKVGVFIDIDKTTTRQNRLLVDLIRAHTNHEMFIDKIRYSIPINDPNAFWRDQYHYDKVRKAIIDGNIVCVSGSIAGELTMQSISNTLRKLRVETSVFDISNVLDYLGIDPVNNHRRLLRNFKGVSWAPDAQILLTNHHRIYYDKSKNPTGSYPEDKRKTKGLWDYFAVPASLFLEHLEAYSSHPDFMRQIPLEQLLGSDYELGR